MRLIEIKANSNLLTPDSPFTASACWIHKKPFAAYHFEDTTPVQIQIVSSNEADEYYFDEGCFILELSNSPADPKMSIARAGLRLE